MSRQRLTWSRGDRRASAPPAMPNEGLTHPAAYPDPGPHDYENGDTSSWGEDVHQPPYRTSPAPAMPYDDGGYRHPATLPGAPAKNASYTSATHAKALKCVRVASLMLGPDVTRAAESFDRHAEDLVTHQAYDLMALPESSLDATLRRLEAAADPDEALLRQMLAEEAEEDEAEEDESEEAESDEEASKKASFARRARARRAGEEVEKEEESESDEEASKKASLSILAELRSLRAEVAALRGRKAGEETEAEGGEETEAEGGKEACGEDMDDEALLQQMLQESTVDLGGDELDSIYGGPAAAYLSADEEDPFALATADEGMALMDMVPSEEDEAMLSSLFAETAPKSAAARTAAAKLRPQPKLPSNGVRTVGNLTRQASAKDSDDLASLWESAPDVTRVFGK